MSAEAERHQAVLTVIHHGNVLPAPIYVDVARAVSIENACERHPIICILWCQS